MAEYPEIEALKAYFKKYSITINKTSTTINEELFFVDFTINQKKWQILVDDEYKDFNPEKPLVNLFLVFNSLELYEEADDFLVWCNYFNLDTSSSQWLDYYRGLATIYHEIEEILGKIDSCINPLDYQLRTGVVSALLQTGI